MQTEYDDKILDFLKIITLKLNSKNDKNDGLDGHKDVKNTLPSHLWALILSNSKRNMNNFTRESKCFYNNSICYTDTDNLYIEKKFWDLLEKAGLNGSSLCQGKND